MLSELTTTRFQASVAPRLGALGRRVRLYALLNGLAILFPAAIAAMLITLVVDRAFRLDWDMRAVQLGTLLLVLIFIAWRWVIAPLRVQLRPTELAMLVERRFPQLSSRLVSAVEFAGADRSARHPAHSRALMEAVVAEAEDHAGRIAFQDVLAHARARKQAAVALSCIGLVVLITVGAGSTMGLWFERNVLLRNVDWPQRNRLAVREIKDGKLVVARGDDVTLTADVVEGYEPPRQVFIEFRGESGMAADVQMPSLITPSGAGPGSAGSFTHTFERIEETLRCRVHGGDARTDWFEVQVVQRPAIEQVSIAVTPPAYTHMERYELRPGQTVAEALKGSRLEFRFKANKPLVRALLVTETGGGTRELGPAQRVSEREFTAQDAPAATASYYLQMEDEMGFSSISDRAPPLRLSVRLLADKPPGVKMRVRGVGEMVTTEAILPIEMDFADAYGLASVGLTFDVGRKDSKPVEEPVEGFEPGTKTFTRTTEWQAARRAVAEGDRLSLQAVARDFDDVSGPNVGESAKVTLRVVSREELLAELNRREQEYRQDFERLIRAQEELYAELLSLSRATRPSSPGRDRQNAYTLLARRQRDHAGRLNTVRIQFEQVLSELEVNQLSSPTVETRLGGGIIEPMGTLYRTRLPAAADGLDLLSRNAPPAAIEAAKTSQDAILADMNRILANMQKWEGFQEAVALLREVLKMQGHLNQEVERQLEAEIFGPPAGTRPASQPSK